MAASLNWSMTIVGYPKHQRSGTTVVGVSHMTTHEVMRFAEALNFYTGWLLAEGAQPQLEGVRAGRPMWIALAEMFAERRIVKTEGIASGALVFAAAAVANGQPPGDRSLIAWAEEQKMPWVEIIDNEAAYWGGLTEPQIDQLMLWFYCQRPIEQDWRTTRFQPKLAARLRQGLVEHGWTRNLALSKPGRKPSIDLWGGVHSSCMLDHAKVPPLSQAHAGIRLTLSGGEWSGKDLGDRCALSDETGKVPLG